MSILVTGASGFVGGALEAHLRRRDLYVRSVVRRRRPGKPADVVIPSIDDRTDWHDALGGVDAVVHLAARVHMLRESDADPLASFRRVNVAGTIRLVEAAADAGVRRFVFVSTMGVHGPFSENRPIREDDPAAPASDYARSKWEAECALRTRSDELGLELVVVRPPLVYGPRMRGRLLQLLVGLSRGIPLPLASIRNRRSFLYVENLTDLIEQCLTSEAAVGQAFLANDGPDLSTPELVRRLAASIGRRPRLLPCPPKLLWLGARALRREHLARVLTWDAAVDAAKVRRTLSWKPPHGLAAGFEATGRWFLSSREDAS